MLILILNSNIRINANTDALSGNKTSAILATEDTFYSLSLIILKLLTSTNLLLYKTAILEYIHLSRVMTVLLEYITLLYLFSMSSYYAWCF